MTKTQYYTKLHPANEALCQSDTTHPIGGYVTDYKYLYIYIHLARLNYHALSPFSGLASGVVTWEIALLPRQTAFSSVTDISRGKFPVLNIHGYVKMIIRSAHDI